MKPNSKPAQQPAETNKLTISKGINAGVQRVLLYGTGGVGKTELASLLTGALIIDLEDGSKFLNVSRVQPTTWGELRAVLQDRTLLEQFTAVVIDSLTRAEDMAIQWVVENVPHEKGHKVSNIEDFGFGKGMTHVYKSFLELLQDLDAVIRSGKNVVCVCHDCVTTVPNPAGDDWIRYEPRLQSPPSGKNSVRHRVKEWVDHLLFVAFDQYVEDGKAKGGGTRTIYPTEMPSWWAKSRKLSDPIPYERGSAALWDQLFAKGQ